MPPKKPRTTLQWLKGFAHYCRTRWEDPVHGAYGQQVVGYAALKRGRREAIELIEGCIQGDLMYEFPQSKVLQAVLDYCAIAKLTGPDCPFEEPPEVRDFWSVLEADFGRLMEQLPHEAPPSPPAEVEQPAVETEAAAAAQVPIPMGPIIPRTDDQEFGLRMARALKNAQRIVNGGVCPFCKGTGFKQVERGIWRCNNFGRGCAYQCVTERGEKSPPPDQEARL